MPVRIGSKQLQLTCHPGRPQHFNDLDQAVAQGRLLAFSGHEARAVYGQLYTKEEVVDFLPYSSMSIKEFLFDVYLYVKSIYIIIPPKVPNPYN